MMTRKIDRRTAQRVLDAHTCKCGRSATEFIRNEIKDLVPVCTQCAMAHAYSVAAANRTPWLFD